MFSRVIRNGIGAESNGEFDPKRIVREGYDACGHRYNRARSRVLCPEVTYLLNTLRKGAHTLDIGCGGGIPMTAAMARTTQVTGIDLSAAQIEQARKNVPGASFMTGDVMDMDFPKRSFDAVVSFYTLFHLPRDQHGVLLERIAGWLVPGGHLMITTAPSAHPGYTEPDFFGVNMYWSHYGLSWYRDTLSQLGYRVLVEKEISHGYASEPYRPAEPHTLIEARIS